MGFIRFAHSCNYTGVFTFIKLSNLNSSEISYIIHSICNLVQINLGPQHPSTHGVLRITCLLECESIKWIEADIGLLHRGSEKLIEYRSANKSLP